MKKQHKTLKALLSVLLVIFMMCPGLVSISAYAASTTIHYVEDDFHMALPDDPDAPSLSYTLEEYLISEIKKCETSIDLSSYYISPEKINYIASLIYDNTPELFHVTRFGYTTIFGYILTINPEYSCTAEEYQEMMAGCDAVTEKMIADIKDNENLTDVEKALLVHDRIALNCAYDYENYLNDAVPFYSYSMYGVLVTGVGVCQGYAEAYLYILRQLGIDGYLCESETLNHAWNIIIINGEEYHVDITWDDPVNDVTGRVKHTNFLRSTEGMYATGHEADDYASTPVSTTYDNSFWQDSLSAFQLVDDEIYYIDETDSNIKKYSDNSVVKSVSDMWMTSATSYYPGCYARLASDGTYLYYNSSQAVFEFDPVNDITTEIWRPESVTEYYRIYGFNYANNYLICDFYTKPSFTLTTKADYQHEDEEVILENVSINTYPTVSEFDINEVYSANGLSLLLEYSNSSTEIITDGFELSTADTSAEGTKTVTVTYESFTVSYTFNVVCKHKDVTNFTANKSTCIAQGNEAYTKCNTCNRIISGSDALLPLTGHNHISAVTTPPTCTENGVMTYTCSVCSDSYTETIKSAGHTYDTVVTPPTCTEEGYTTYTCACGDTYVADYEDALGHSYDAVVTPPTCTEEGYTTYTCACGDTYVADYEDALGHSYDAVVTPPTCTEEGYTTYSCVCGDTYVADYEDALGHSYDEVVTPPTCTEEGYTTYTCTCGDTFTDDYTAALGHEDNDGDEYCDFCDENLAEDTTVNCSCNCHSTNSFISFFWKILNFFQKLFKTNPVCECGAAHY